MPYEELRAAFEKHKTILFALTLLPIIVSIAVIFSNVVSIKATTIETPIETTPVVEAPPKPIEYITIDKDEIEAKLDELFDAQQQEYLNGFIGQYIKGKYEVYNIRTREPYNGEPYYVLSLIDSKGDMIFGDFSSDQKEKLFSLKKNEIVTVVGQIREVDGYGYITLYNCRIE